MEFNKEDTNNTGDEVFRTNPELLAGHILRQNIGTPPPQLAADPAAHVDMPLPDLPFAFDLCSFLQGNLGRVISA